VVQDAEQIRVRGAMSARMSIRGVAVRVDGEKVSVDAEE
jgi:hypothetical protein